MRVAKDRRSPRANVVDVAFAVGVADIGALPALEESGRAADRTKGADRRIDTGGNGALGAREEFVVAAHGTPFALRASVFALGTARRVMDSFALRASVFALGTARRAHGACIGLDEKEIAGNALAIARAAASTSAACEHRRDHGNCARSRPDQHRRVGGRNSADRDDRNAERTRGPEQLDRGTAGIWLHGRRKETAERDVIRTVSDCNRCKRKIVVARDADEPVRTHDFACIRDARVIHPDVDAVGTRFHGKSRVVVDDEETAANRLHARERQRLRALQRGVGGLVAILDRRGAAGERGRDARSEVVGVLEIRGDCVQARDAEGARAAARRRIVSACCRHRRRAALRCRSRALRNHHAPRTVGPAGTDPCQVDTPS